MILDELTLHNFGLYAERQTVTLTPPCPQQPIILLGGLNGGGKTTLLDALQLCFYGPFATISNRGALAYHEYLARSIHRGAPVREAALEIAFRHTIDGQEDQYRLHRSWRTGSNGCKEHFEVLKNGRPEPSLAENWIGQVDEFIPPNIAHLFLFDGEQIEAYGAKEKSAALISGAIQNLLGLDIVDQLEKDLVVYERRKRTDEKNDAAGEEIAAAEAALRELRSRIDQLRQQQASLKTHQLDRKRSALAETEETFRKLGGELYEQRTEIERATSRAQQRVETGAKELRDIAAGVLPLCLVRPLLKSLQTRDHAEEESRRARDVLETLKGRDAAILEHLRAHSAGASVVAAVSAFLKKDRKKRYKLAKRGTVLDLPPETRADLTLFLREELDMLSEQARSKRQEQEEAEHEAEQFQLTYDSMPGADTIAECLAQRANLKQDIAELEAAYGQLGSELEGLSREAERRQQALSRLLEAQAQISFGREDRSRMLRHSAKVRNTLGGFRRAVVARHVRRIEELVLQSYRQLLRKISLVTRLSIDPESFTLELYGRDGEILNPERLSAGERQLLATALLWGLAKASGRPLPTAIDTPLGRLDTSHRMHLVERYFPFASHQVLLLSTDEEITGEYLRRLKPWIGRTYALSYDDAAGRTTVVPGYFEEREAA
jgi:DNA sulfur modification protein DndD